MVISKRILFTLLVIIFTICPRMARGQMSLFDNSTSVSNSSATSQNSHNETAVKETQTNSSVSNNPDVNNTTPALPGDQMTSPSSASVEKVTASQESTSKAPANVTSATPLSSVTSSNQSNNVTSGLVEDFNVTTKRSDNSTSIQEVVTLLPTQNTNLTHANVTYSGNITFPFTNSTQFIYTSQAPPYNETTGNITNFDNVTVSAPMYGNNTNLTTVTVVNDANMTSRGPNVSLTTEPPQGENVTLRK
jgi:cytoskeletal protein RodZ